MVIIAHFEVKYSRWVKNYSLLDDQKNKIYCESAVSFNEFNEDKSKTISRLEVCYQAHIDLTEYNGCIKSAIEDVNIPEPDGFVYKEDSFEVQKVTDEDRYDILNWQTAKWYPLTWHLGEYGGSGHLPEDNRFRNLIRLGYTQRADKLWHAEVEFKKALRIGKFQTPQEARHACQEKAHELFAPDSWR